jgi:glycosyltransferase involved in cell wall biosynthesis
LSRGALHQIVPSLGDRDAIGAHVLHARALLRELGFESDVYRLSVSGGTAARRASRPLRRLARDLSGATRSGPGRTWLLYHCSTGSEAVEALRGRPEPLIVDYHNITPAELFAGWDPQLAHAAELGRRQLAELASRAVAGLADSSFNRDELARAGFRQALVAPLLVDTMSAEPPDPAALDALLAGKRDGGARWLTVGRLAPNKAQHDVVLALAAYRRLFDPAAQLHLVGRPDTAAYARAVEALAADLGLTGAVDVTGSVSPGELAAHYRAADVLVHLSDHEGFGVPLVEAMGHRLPVVAHDATAVGETVADAGLLLPRKTPTLVAVAVHRVLTDDPLRRSLVDAGAARAAALNVSRTRDQFAAAIEAVVGE